MLQTQATSLISPLQAVQSHVDGSYFTTHTSVEPSMHFSLEHFFRDDDESPFWIPPESHHNKHECHFHGHQPRTLTEDDATQTSSQGPLELTGQSDVDDQDDEDDDCFEEEYAEAYREHMTPDSPTRLLQFVRTITADICGRLARNNGQDDYCDVYEERFKTTLSGRRLYYADLLALASNSEAPSSSMNAVRKKRVDNVTCNRSGRSKTCYLPHQGQPMRAVGLGPLEELFPRHLSKYQADYRDKFKAVPMTMRKLPNSFWNEPVMIRLNDERQYSDETVGHTPDFTDLFDNWTDKC